MCHVCNNIPAALCLPLHGRSCHCPELIRLYLLNRDTEHAWWTQSCLSKISFMWFAVWVVWELCACVCLMSCFLFVCWLIFFMSLPQSASVCVAAEPPAFFPASFSWSLLRRRDKAHWCLSAHWQITEADRYKDSGRQLLYAGGQRRTCLGCLSWPQHQSILNTIWLLYTCSSSWANYGLKITQRVNVGNRRKLIWTRKESEWFHIL